MKKFLITAFCAVLLLLLTAASSVRAIHDNVPIFEEPDFDSAILFTIPRNASVLLVEEEFVLDNIRWQKIKYGSFEGYADASSLYVSFQEPSFTVKHIKATSLKMGQEIKIYDINSENGNVIATVKDGTKLQRIVSDIDYGDFYEISFNNQRAFVQKKHATHSLTLNQKTALIVGAVTLAVIAAVFALIMFIRRSARR